MNFEGDVHHVDMQFAFSMIHINVISLITVCAFSHKPCSGNYRTSVAPARQIFLSDDFSDRISHTYVSAKIYCSF